MQLQEWYWTCFCFCVSFWWMDLWHILSLSWSFDSFSVLCAGAMRRCHCRNFKQHKSNRRSRTFVIHLELFYVCRKLLLSRGKLYFLVCSFLTFCNPCGDFLRMSMQLLYMSGLERHWFNFLIDSVWVSQFAVVSEIIYINVEWGSALFSNWMAENGIYRKQLNDSDVQ